jgi:hypothetical protein
MLGVFMRVDSDRWSGLIYRRHLRGFNETQSTRTAITVHHRFETDVADSRLPAPSLTKDRQKVLSLESCRMASAGFRWQSVATVHPLCHKVIGQRGLLGRIIVRSDQRCVPPERKWNPRKKKQFWRSLESDGAGAVESPCCSVQLNQNRHVQFNHPRTPELHRRVHAH